MFADRPTLFARTRALYRCFNMQMLDDVSLDTWTVTWGMEAHLNEFLRGNSSGNVSSVSATVRERTATSLFVPDVMNLYCTVKHMFAFVTLFPNLLNLSAATHQLSKHPSSRGHNHLGTSFDIVASLINHSCDPNVFIVFEGSKLQVWPIRPLRAC